MSDSIVPRDADSQLEFEYPSGPVDARTEQVLGLIAADPAHTEDVRRVVRAIVKDASEHGGHVDPNRVRRQITDANGDFLVTPQVVGAAYNSLRTRGFLTPTGWTINADRHGNSGKPIRTYLFRGAA